MSVLQDRTLSLLDHPCFQTSTTPVVASCPFDQALASEKEPRLSHSQSLGFEKKFMCLEKDLQGEKLSLSKKDALLLSSVARDARSEHTDIPWNSILPPLLRADNLRSVAPIHMADSSLVGHTDLHQAGVESLVRRESSPCTPKDFSSHVESVIGDLKNEKLVCSKESLVFIQNARKCDACPNDMAACFDASLRPFQVSIIRTQHGELFAKQSLIILYRKSTSQEISSLR